MKINLRSIFNGAILALLATQGSLYGIWQPPVTVSNPAFPAFNEGGAVLRVTPQGNAIAVWTVDGTETFPDERAIASSFYTRGVGWFPPQIISSLETLPAPTRPAYIDQRDPDIALNSSGYSVAVWEAVLDEEVPSRIILAARRGSNGIWSPVETISDQRDVFGHVNPNVSVNEAGTALAAWRSSEIEAIGNNTVVSFLPFGGAWTTPLYFPSEAANNNNNKPYPVINPSGNAVVTWRSKTEGPDTYYITAATYNALTSTWSAPFNLDTVLSDTLQENPRCDMDASGRAVAVWLNNGSARAAFFNGTSWEPSVTLGIADLNDEPYVADVVMDLNGNATAVWQGEGPVYPTYASSRLPNGTWTPPQVISTPGVETSFAPFMSQEPLAVNPEGDVIATWIEYPAAGIVVKAAFKLFGQPWRLPETVFNVGDTEPQFLNIGIASCGFAVALWQQDIPDSNIVNASVNENLLLPFGARGKRCCDSFAAQKVCMNVLNWEPDLCALSYNVYRDGVLIANIPGSQALKYVDPLGCKKSSHTYTVTVINIYGFEGDPVPFVF